MSHAYYHKKPKGQNIDITVTFRYHGLKATQHFAKFTPQSLQVIRDDALQLRIPHPKSDNVTLVTHGQVEFSWFDVESYGVLHKNLLQKLRPSDPAQQESLKQLLVELSITSATFREVPAGTSTEQINFQTKKRPNAHLPQPGLEPPKKKFLPSTNAPAKPTPDFNAADDFIKEAIAKVKALAPPVFVPSSQNTDPKVKAEPVDISLSSLIGTGRYSAPLAAKQTSSLPRVLAQGSGSIPSSTVNSSLPPPTGGYHSSVPGTAFSFKAKLPSQPTVSLPPPPPPTAIAYPPPPSARSSFAAPFSPSQSTLAPTPSPSFTFAHPSSSGSSISAHRGYSDIGETKTLKRELWDVRKQLQHGVSREASIVKDLNKSRDYFDNPLVPTYGAAADTNAKQAANIKDLQARMEGFQKQVDEERKVRQDVEILRKELVEERRARKEGEDALRQEFESLRKELQEERRRREEGEAVLHDIRREMTHPFIVPQLLDALVAISKISSDVVKS